MIPPYLLHELIDLLSSLTQTASERFTLLMGAFGNGHPILNQLKWTETTENFLTDMLNKLDEHGEVAPGKRAVWALMESLLEPGRVGVDKQGRIRALEKVLNASTTPAVRRSGNGLSVFISYARDDDEPFAERLRDDLTGHGFKVWWDRTSLSNRGLGFLQEIRQAIIQMERVILVFGPDAEQSPYVRMEWEFALSICKPVLTLLRLGDYDLLPEALKRSDVPDFRDDSQYPAKLDYLVRQLCEPAAPLGKLVNVPLLPPQFQARPKDLQAIKDKLLVDTSKPVVVTAPSRRAGLQGLGGIGKTVLATALAHDCDVRRSFPDGVLWVTLGQTPNIMARQADLCRALGDPPQTFVDVQQGKARLSELLREKACLLVIDDLWELEHARAFEATGPRGALLITTRDERLVDDLGATKHRVDVLNEEEALTLMARWLATGDDTPAYDEPEQKAQLERLKAAMPPEAKVVAHECGYLPLALALSASQVRDGVAWGTLLTELQAANLDFLDSPNGSVQASLKVSIDALERENAANARHYIELAIFPEDTTIPETTIMTLWLHTNGLRPATAERLLITLGKRSLLRLEGAAPDRRIHLHDLQHDYLRLALKNANAVHREFVEAYRQKCDGQWHKEPNDGYYFEHLAYHLCQAGQTAELYTLLTGSPDWMEAKFVACIGDSSYMADLDLALRDFADLNADPDRLLTLAKLHTARQVIHARVSVYDDTDLKTLVWLGGQTEALSHARLRAEARDKFDGLLAIYEALKEKGHTDPTLLDEAGAAARSIQNDSLRFDILSALAAVLAQAGRFEEAGAVARAIQDDYSRVDALCTLAAALAQAGESSASGVFEEAGTVARAIQGDYFRVNALCALAAALSQAGEAGASGVFEEAETVARASQNDSLRASVLLALAAALAQASRFEEAGAVARTIQDNSSRAHALSALAAALAQAGEASASNVFEEAGTVARAIQDDTYRAHALSALAAALAQAGRFEEAGAVARAIQDDASRASALSALAAVLAQAGRASASGVFEEAGVVARAIQHDWNRAHALSALALALAQANEASANGIFEEARAARAIRPDWIRAPALGALAVVLAQAERFEEAGAVARAIRDDASRVDALCALAVVLAQAGEANASGVFEEAGAVARAIQDDASRASALSALAAALAQTGEASASGVFEEAGTVARAIQDDTYRALALRALAESLAQAGRFEEAEAVTRAIQDDTYRALALRALAESLAQAGRFEEVEAVARTTQDNSSRADALCALAAALAQASRFEEAGAVARTIQDNSSRADALCALAAALAQAGEASASGVFEEAGAVSRAIQFDASRALALRALAAALAQAGEASASSVFEEVGAATRAIQDNSLRTSALRALAVAHAQAGCFDEAFNTLSQREAGEFLQTIAQWSPAFEKVKAGLSVTILREAVRIIGWSRLDWRKIHELMIQP